MSRKTRKNNKTKMVLVVQPTTRNPGPAPRRRPKRRQLARNRVRSRMGKGGMGMGVIDFLSCSSMTPMRFPDGTYQPSLPFQTRTQYVLGTNGSGSAAYALVPDVIQQWGSFAYQSIATFASGNFPITAWVPSFGSNAGFTASVLADSARARPLAVRVCGTYIGSSLADAGLVYVKQLAMSREQVFAGGDLNLLTALGITVPSDQTLVDYRGPLREGFETLLQPLDPTSRKYLDTAWASEITAASADPEVAELQELVTQLYLDQNDNWPTLVVMIVGGAASSPGSLGIEVVIDWEIQPTPSGIAARAALPPPPDNPAFRAAIGNTYRKVVEVGGTVVSRVASNAVGGFRDWLVKSLSVAATGLLTHTASRFAPRDSVMGRLAGVGPHPRITEL